MITSRQIMMAMGTAEISRSTLHSGLSKYLVICQFDVDNIIINGVDGYLQKFVAVVLDMKKFVPEGWSPKLLKKEFKFIKKSAQFDVTRADFSKPRKKKARKWTEKDFRVAKIMRDNGVSCEQISLALGRTPSAIATKLSERKNMAKMKLTSAHKRFHLWVMQKPCAVPGCQQPSIFHHQKQPFPLPRRDHKYGVNICSHHHSEYHDKYGSDDAFAEEYGIYMPDYALVNLEYWDGK